MTAADRAGLLPGFLSTRGHAAVVGAALVLAAAVSWAAAGYDIAELRALAGIQAGGAIAPGDRLALARARSLAGAAQLASAALVAAVFLPWLHRARVNLRALGVRRPRFGREWTYLAFAVPGLNAFRPCQVVCEVWRGSDPATGDPLAWRQIPVPPLVIAWWVALVAWLAMEFLAALPLGFASGRVPVQLVLGISLMADVCGAASASLGYFVVTRISAAQDAKWSAFGAGNAAAAR